MHSWWKGIVCASPRRVFGCAGALVIVACTKSGDLEPRGRGAERVAAAVCAASVSEEEAALVCNRWACAHADLAGASWDGDANRCSPGTIDRRARDRALRSINAYRVLAGVPALESEPRWEPPAQDCALLAHANEELSHYPSRDWSCWTERGVRASAVSLLANRSAPLAIDAFIEDPGNEPTMVHRRWLLSEKIRRVGLGSTSRFSCVVVDGREWDGDDVATAGASREGGTKTEVHVATGAIPTWVAWPPPGPVPFDVFERTNVDGIGWTVQSSTLDLDGARVTVSVAGQGMPIEIAALERTLGSLTALRFKPRGWSSKVGARYDVHVEKEGVVFDYAVTPIDCESGR